MRKIAGIMLALAAMVGISAAPANAVTVYKGTISNQTFYGIYTSSTYPTWTSQGILYPGQSRSNVVSFQCFSDCISQWGYNYYGKGVVPMTTPGTIYLHD